MAHCSRQVEVRINPLFNPQSLKNKLWALFLPVNSSRLQQNPVWLWLFIHPDASVCPQLSPPELAGCHQWSALSLHSVQSSPCYTLHSLWYAFDLEFRIWTSALRMKLQLSIQAYLFDNVHQSCGKSLMWNSSCWLTSILKITMWCHKKQLNHNTISHRSHDHSSVCATLFN